MTNASVYEGIYQGERAIWLRAGNYEAAILPEIGANCIAFRDVARGYSYLHEPMESEMNSFKEQPIIHGIPVLFPPNRFEDGKFPWQGKVYSFPINETDRGNHLHGFLHSTTWEVDQTHASDEEASATFSVSVDENHPIYTHFPHVFTFKLRYTLSEDGLCQHVWIRNEGDQPMPCLLAFHTALNVPFAPNAQTEDYRVRLTIGNRWEMNDRMLPTGRYQAMSDFDRRLQQEGVDPFEEAMDNHYTAQPQNGRNRMELMDKKNNMTLVYDVGTSYKQWVIWNNGASKKFFCPEPQVNIINAPNVQGLTNDEKGLFSLGAGEVWEEIGRLYIKDSN